VGLSKVTPMDLGNQVGVQHLVVLDLSRKEYLGDHSIWIERGRGRLFRSSTGSASERERVIMKEREQ
jgi:hypothetical protein